MSSTREGRISPGQTPMPNRVADRRRLCWPELWVLGLVALWIMRATPEYSGCDAQALAGEARKVPAFAPHEVLVRVDPAAAKGMDPAKTVDPFHSADVIAVEPLFPKPPATAKIAGRGALDCWVRVRLAGSLAPAEVAAAWSRLPAVECVQVNHLRRLCSEQGDSLRGEQWNLDEVGWTEPLSGVPTRVLIGVIDSGIDLQHPDLRGQIWRNLAEVNGIQGVDDDGNGYVDDVNGWDFVDAPDLPGEGDYMERDADPSDESGHGTHVAGIIAARAGNGIGIAGIAPNAQLMVLRAGFNLDGQGYLEDDDLAAALVYAVENGARVVNMSWGDPAYSPLLEDAIRYAWSHGVLLAAAAGNEAAPAAFYPARFSETIAVAATGRKGVPTSFTNWGPSMDLGAPGAWIWSTVPGGRYAQRSGTSMAAAHVSGAAARLLLRRPELSPEEVRAVLALGAASPGASPWSPVTGAGVVQLGGHGAGACALRIACPAADSILADEVEVEVLAQGITEWELAWGHGELPSEWHVLARAGDGEDAAVVWNLAELKAGSYAIRVSAQHGGRILVDQVPLRLAEKAPVVVSAALRRALKAGAWIHLLQWSTDVAANGNVRLCQSGHTVHQVRGEPLRRNQQVEFPAGLEAGVYKVELQTMAGDVRGPWRPMGEIRVRGGPVLESRPVRGSMPAGYPMPAIVDLNQDGWPDLGVMPSAGSRYSSPRFYTYGPAGANLAYTALRLFIPWAAPDVNGDGRPELLAVDARRVRLLTAEGVGQYPERLMWEQTGVWGGETADLDGDGLDELYLRADQGSRFLVYAMDAGKQIEQVAALVNPTAHAGGDDALGIRQVTGDFDGDGRGELLAGDGDGDLFVFETAGVGAYHVSWEQRAGDLASDARTVGGGADLDGDGRIEFVVARLHAEPYRVHEAFWEVEVYQPLGDNEFGVEWSAEIRGGIATGNGIAVLDHDNNGTVEWALAVVPDLYLFRSTGIDKYEPLWHTRVGPTYRPAVGDWDQDGQVELAARLDSVIRVFGRTVAGLPAPGRFAGYPRDAGCVVLAWDPVRGATGYRLWRDGEVLARHQDEVRYLDQNVEEEESYTYSVAAVDTAGQRVGERSGGIVVRPAPAPRLVAVERVGLRTLALHFSAPMCLGPADLHGIQVSASLGRPRSLMADQGGRRALLGFGEPLPDQGQGWIEMGGARAATGAPLAADGRRLDFALTPATEVVRALAAEVLSPERIQVNFSGPVALPEEPATRIHFEPAGISVQSVSVQDTIAWIELNTATPLLPVGRTYRLQLAGWETPTGGSVFGDLELRLAAASLEDVQVFPNPYCPEQGVLHFTHLPAAARVQIHDVSGGLVRALDEEDGDGGLIWDGRNGAGRRVGSGIYHYMVIAGTGSVRGRLAVVRQ